jgi:hypothetical protein
MHLIELIYQQYGEPTTRKASIVLVSKPSIHLFPAEPKSKASSMSFSHTQAGVSQKRFAPGQDKYRRCRMNLHETLLQQTHQTS